MRSSTAATRKANGSREEGSSFAVPRADALRRCADACNETLAYCLERGGDHVEPEHVRCLIDTATLCNLVADLVARESSHAQEFLELCADVCACTAEGCAEFEDDAQMKACEDACRAAFEFAGQGPR